MRWHELAGRVMRALPVWLSAAWAMGLSTLGLFVVPMLFANLPTPAMAGVMAGKLFSTQTIISVTCALAILLLLRGQKPAAGEGPRAADAMTSLLLLAGALCAMVVEFGVSPHIRAHDNLPFWHGLGTTLYFVQWICALMVFARLTRERTGQ